MNINLSLSPATGIPANYLVVAVYEATSPTVVAAFQAFPAPHTASQNVTFSNLNPVVHIVKVFENATAAVGGTVRHNFIYNPWFTNAQIRMDLWLTADTTPGFVSSGLSYVDATLKDWTFNIERRGYGTMEPGIDYSWNNTTTTWTLLATVATPTPEIQPGEKFIIHFQPKITVSNVPPQNNSINLYNEVMQVAVTSALMAADMGKLIWIIGANPYLEVTLPDITTVLANRPLMISSQGGSHVTALLKCFGTNKIAWLGGNLSEIGICQSESLWLVKWVDPNDASVYHWKVLNPDGNFKTAGELVDSYSLTAINTIQANGQLVSRDNYYRIWKAVQNFDVSMLVSEANWSNAALNNKGKFSTGDGATTFRLPLLPLAGFLRVVDGVTRKAGDFEAAMLLDHKHGESIGTLPAGSTPDGHGPSAQNQGRYAGSANGQPDLTSSPTKADGTPAAIGTENRPSNTGVYKLIRY